MLEAGDFWVMASDIEKGLDERKQEQYKKWWELPSEKHNIAVGIFWRKKTKTQTNAKTKQKNQNNPTLWRGRSHGNRSDFYPLDCYCL